MEERLMTGKLLSDFIYGLALFVNAALFIPQAIKIFVKRNADDVSLITFGGFNLIQVCGFVNGVYNNDYALIFGQGFSVIACGLVTLQIIYYKINKKKAGKAGAVFF